MKILVADDCHVSLATLQALLSQYNYNVIAVDDGDKAYNVLTQDNPPRLAILDWIMPGKDGAEICRELQNKGRYPYIYSLLLTAKNRQKDIVEGLDAGADDYITKPFFPQELLARLRVGARMIELHDTLHQMTTYDTLTQLYNRTSIIGMLEKEISRAQRHTTSLCAIACDLDNFKRINDEFGHLAGDAVIREVSEKIRVNVRNYDSIGRIGGEEFLIVMPNCGQSTASNQAERIRQCVEKTLFNYEGMNLTTSMSFGVSVASDVSGATPDMYLKAAAEALCRAKNNGRNRVETSHINNHIYY